MQAVQKQEEQLTFAEVVTRHQEMVYRYLIRFTRHQQDAQDLFQETFLRAHRAYATLPDAANVQAWLMRIAINLTKNYVRDRQRYRRVIVATEDPGDVPLAHSTEKDGLDTEGVMILRETGQRLLTAIEALPFHQRAALVQRQFEGLDYAAIAANLHCSQDSARAHVYQALRKLRAALDLAASDGQER